VASGPLSALLSSEASTSLIIGILAFHLNEIVGGNCCGGLIQGNVAGFGRWMCVEEVLPGLGHCLVKTQCQSFAFGKLDKGSTGQGLVSGRSVQGRNGTSLFQLAFLPILAQVRAYVHTHVHLLELLHLCRRQVSNCSSMTSSTVVI
jgi:hypothetical protein